MATVIAGFRIERLLGEGEMGPVYEAVQLSLDRPVALRVLPEGAAVGASVDHPNIVPTYEAGEWDGRRFSVSRLVRGTTLDATSLSPRRFDEVMAAVADAVATAHRAGVAHGRLAAHNVIVDRSGTPFITDFGVRRSGTREADLEALAALRSKRPKRLRWPAAVAAGVAVLLATAGVLLVGGRENGSDAAESVGCSPEPDLNTPACTVSQDVVDGRRIQVEADGVVRGWTVRGATGELTLEVLRDQDGRIARAGFSPPVDVRGPGSRTVPASLDVRRGDRIGVLLGPGARIGVRQRRGATVRLWEGRRNPLPRTSRTLEGELALRVHLRPGVRAATPRQLTGARAADAPAGSVLAETDVEIGASRRVDVRLVRSGRSIAIDSFRGSRRLARIAVPDAAARGTVVELSGDCEFPGAVCLQWRNAGETRPVIHAYALARAGARFRVIG